jgi:hypothetical protein
MNRVFAALDSLRADEQSGNLAGTLQDAQAELDGLPAVANDLLAGRYGIRAG